MNSCMLFKKHLNAFAFMPSRTVNIQPDFISPQFFANFMQTFQKSFPVSFGCSDNAAFTYQRSYPTKNIQSQMMVTGCGNTQSFSDFSPTSSQPWMCCKTGFIFKYYSFTRSKNLKFFLNGSKTASPHGSSPVHMNNRLSLTEIQADASSTGPDAPSGLCQTAVSNILPKSGRPIGFGLILLPSVFFLNSFPALSVFYRSFYRGGQSGVSTLTLLIHSCLRHVSNCLNFPWMSQELLKPIPAADPPLSATLPLFLSQFWHMGHFWRRLSVPLGLLLCASILFLDFSCIKYIILLFICQLIYCVCIRSLNYAHQNCYHETFGKSGTLGRETPSDVVLTSRLRQSLIAINPTMSSEAIDLAIEELTRALLLPKLINGEIDVGGHFEFLSLLPCLSGYATLKHDRKEEKTTSRYKYSCQIYSSKLLFIKKV